MKPCLRASYLGSLGALGVAACCVMPMVLILLGLGGGWLAVFGKIAAFSFPVLGVSTVLLIAAWGHGGSKPCRGASEMVAQRQRRLDRYRMGCRGDRKPDQRIPDNPDVMPMDAPTLISTIICPECGQSTDESMPTDACQWFYQCRGCGAMLTPRRGDCCVFCSYGTVPCPPAQNRSCCGR